MNESLWIGAVQGDATPSMDVKCVTFAMKKLYNRYEFSQRVEVERYDGSTNMWVPLWVGEVKGSDTASGALPANKQQYKMVEASEGVIALETTTTTPPPAASAFDTSFKGSCGAEHNSVVTVVVSNY